MYANQTTNSRCGCDNASELGSGIGSGQGTTNTSRVGK